MSGAQSGSSPVRVDATLPNDAYATVPLLFTDQFGRTALPPAGGVSVSDSTVATAALSADGTNYVLTPVEGTSGIVTVTYTGANSNGSFSFNDTFAFAAPAAVAGSADLANIVFAALPVANAVAVAVANATAVQAAATPAAPVAPAAAPAAANTPVAPSTPAVPAS